MDEGASLFAQQALKAYPGLRSILAWHGRQMHFIEIRSAILNGAPLLPEICQAFSVKPWVVRHVLGRGHSERLPPDWLIGLMLLMKHIPPEKAPSNEEEWACATAFFICIKNCQMEILQRWIADIAIQGWETEDFDKKLEMICKWLKYLNKGLHKRFESEYSSEVIQSAMPELQCLILEKLSWKKSLDVAKQWKLHSGIFYEDNWPVLFSEPLEFPYSGIAIRSLENYFAVIEAGRVLHNCLYNQAKEWADACLNGKCQLVCIVDIKTGKILSVMELNVQRSKSGRYIVSVGQHFGIMNTPPSPLCEEIEKKILSHLGQEQFQSKLAEHSRILAESASRAKIANVSAQAIKWVMTDKLESQCIELLETRMAWMIDAREMHEKKNFTDEIDSWIDIWSIEQNIFWQKLNVFPRRTGFHTTTVR